MAKEVKAVVPYGTFNAGDLDIVRENLGENAKLGPFDLPRIKIPTGGQTQFALPGLGEDPEYVKEIVGVIVYYRNMRSYWKGEYSGEGAPPDCQSPDAIMGYGNPGGKCSACPYAAFNSGKNGGQACKLMLTLFIRTADSQLPYTIMSPPTSVRKVQDYLRALTGKTKLYYGVVTSLKLGTDKNKQSIVYSVLKPSYVGDVPPEVIEQIREYRKIAVPLFEAVTVDQPPEA